MADSTIIIVGAGPVGMLAALLAAEKGMSVTLLERNLNRPLHSRAIGITPPSLEIFNSIGIDRKLISQGIPVEFSEAHGRQCRLGKLNFRSLKSNYRFILSIPQDRTESILEESLLSAKSVRILRGHNVEGLSHREGIIEIFGKTESGENFSFTSDYLLACDGGKSTIRQAAEIPFDGKSYRNTFLMGDFDDFTNWGREARLYFTSRGSIESFPIAGGKRRFVLRTPSFIKEYTTGYLESEIPSRCRINTRNARKHWESGFGVQRFLARRFCRDGIFLCGDAAHLMSPIGGQNMNTGFADAELAVWLIHQLIQGSTGFERAQHLYNRVRKRAADCAAWRAEMMMRLGTSGGVLWSTVRNFMVAILLHTPLSRLLLPVFSMQSIPYRNLKACRKIYENEIGL